MHFFRVITRFCRVGTVRGCRATGRRATATRTLSTGLPMTIPLTLRFRRFPFGSQITINADGKGAEDKFKIVASADVAKGGRVSLTIPNFKPGE